MESRITATHCLKTCFAVKMSNNFYFAMPNSHNVASLGLLLSLYALYVEHKSAAVKDDPEDSFVALCDIKALGASCRCVADESLDSRAGISMRHINSRPSERSLNAAPFFSFLRVTW